MQPPLVRPALFRRLTETLAAGQRVAVIGGPGTEPGRVAQAAALDLSPGISCLDLPDDESACLDALGTSADARLVSGGLALHRALDALDTGLRRFPLVPLLRRDLEQLAKQRGERIPREELGRAFAATGGHPGLFTEWLAIRRSGADPDAVEKELVTRASGLLGRFDNELAHDELAPLYAWLELHGEVGVTKLRRETGATKAALDRLVLAGPVSRTLGEQAEVRIASSAYVEHRRAR